MDGAFFYGGRYNTPENLEPCICRGQEKGVSLKLKRRAAYPPSYVLGKSKVYLSRVCDLTDETLLKDPGITREQLPADDWDETKILGEIIGDAGFERVIVPSAAGDINKLVIFADRLPGKSSVELEVSTPLELSWAFRIPQRPVMVKSISQSKIFLFPFHFLKAQLFSFLISENISTL